MAQKVEVVLVDDLDGSPADETVNFALDGRNYESDGAPPSPTVEAARIRKWAAENGYEVSSRGRLHRDVVEAYRNAKRK